MHTLLVSGDSYTSGWPLESELGHRKFSWPNLVADYFGVQLVDKSRAGSSNYRIYRKAFEGIIDTKIDTVIVCLSHWSRFEIGSTYGEKPGRIYQHIPSASPEIFYKFFNGYKNYTDNLRMIINLQVLSEKYNTRCFFIDTFRNNIYQNIEYKQFEKVIAYNPKEFENMHDERIAEKFAKVKNLEQCIDWAQFMFNKSFQEIIDGEELIKNHPGMSAHKKMAQEVIDFLLVEETDDKNK